MTPIDRPNQLAVDVANEMLLKGMLKCPKCNNSKRITQRGGAKVTYQFLCQNGGHWFTIWATQRQLMAYADRHNKNTDTKLSIQCLRTINKPRPVEEMADRMDAEDSYDLNPNTSDLFPNTNDLFSNTDD